MNKKTLYTLICLLCAVVVLAFLWKNTKHMYTPAEVKVSLLLKVQPDEEKTAFLVKTLPYAADEKNNAPLLSKTLPYAEHEEDSMLSFPNTMPYAAILKNVNDIQNTMWTTHLYQFLQSLNKSISPQVNMVFGDSDHVDLVLNWVIAAHVRLDPPLHNIMVLSVDQPLCDFLESKKLQVTCIAVPPNSFLKSSGPKAWRQGVKSRLVVLRIINYWGYDVASYDSDAVLLRNPQPLYQSNPDVKLFAGSGTFPRLIAEKWGFGLCTCVLMLRSHLSTENLWKYIHKSIRDDDQVIFNSALLKLGVRWENTTKTNNICSVQSAWRSYEPVNCMVFTQEDVCRRCCEKARKQNYYIVHPHSSKQAETKPTNLKHMDAWFLSDRWRELKNDNLEGTMWLRDISTLIDS